MTDQKTITQTAHQPMLDAIPALLEAMAYQQSLVVQVGDARGALRETWQRAVARADEEVTDRIRDLAESVAGAGGPRRSGGRLMEAVRAGRGRAAAVVVPAERETGT